MQLTRELTPLEFVNATLPFRTDSYTPISNREIMDLINEEAYKNDLIINGERFLANNKMTQFIGQYFIQSEESGVGMQVAFKNSYDKTMPFQTAAGAVIFVCTNSMISGEINFKRKHTGDADNNAIEKVIATFELLGEYFEKLLTERERLQTIPANLRQVAELTGRLIYEEDIINTMQANIIKDELENSKNFKHIMDFDFSMYDYYNHVTEALKRSHPRTYLQDHINLHSFFQKNIL